MRYLQDMHHFLSKNLMRRVCVGHFVQEWGGDIARKALSVFGA
jgi:hypothetical protein